MGLTISISKADLAKSIPINEGWADFEITAAYQKPSKDAQSVNYYFTHKLTGDPNERTVEHLFNSKALGTMNTWIAALKGCTVQEVLDSITSGTLSFDVDSVVGKHVMGNVKQDLYEGRILSKIKDFATVGKIPF
jgi:hypothetical protein